MWTSYSAVVMLLADAVTLSETGSKQDVRGVKVRPMVTYCWAPGVCTSVMTGTVELHTVTAAATTASPAT